jgi:tetrahydromethanopterin S-methyltransferase subunit C
MPAGMDEQHSDGRGEHAESAARAKRKSDLRTLRVLWVGLIMYFLIMLNGLRLADKVPYQALILGSLVNAGIIISGIVAIRRVRKRLKE